MPMVLSAALLTLGTLVRDIVISSTVFLLTSKLQETFQMDDTRFVKPVCRDLLY